jgi:hypothetical protein
LDQERPAGTQAFGRARCREHPHARMLEARPKRYADTVARTGCDRRTTTRPAGGPECRPSGLPARADPLAERRWLREQTPVESERSGMRDRRNARLPEGAIAVDIDGPSGRR